MGKSKPTVGDHEMVKDCPSMLLQGTTANPFWTEPPKSPAMLCMTSVGKLVIGVPVSRMNCVSCTEAFVGPENPISVILIPQKPSPADAPFTYSKMPLFIYS